MIFEYFFLSIRYLFIFLMMFLDMSTEVFNFEVQFVYFLLLLVLFMSYLRMHCQIQGYEGLPLFSKRLIIIFLIFGLLIHFELIFIYGVMYGCSFIHLHVDLVMPAPIFEEHVLSPLNDLSVRVEDRLAIDV